MFKQYLEENFFEERLLGEYTWGFELECLVHDMKSFKSIMYDAFEDKISDKNFDDDGSVSSEMTCDRCGGDGHATCTTCGGDGRMSCDTCNGESTVECTECGGSGKDDDDKECEICNGNGQETCNACDGRGSVHCDFCDGSGQEDCDECNGTGTNQIDGGESVEFKSPVLKLTPANVSLVTRTLSELVDEQIIYVNNTCGFHVHIGTPEDINKMEDLWWVLLQISINDDIKNDLKTMEGIEFFNYEYASFGFLNTIKDMLDKYTNGDDSKKTKNPYYITALFDDTKFRSIRLHPQGTLEWRGPRNFINNPNLIKTFFIKKLIPFVKNISKLSNNKTFKYNDMVFKKDEIFKIMKDDEKNKIHPYNFKHEVKNKLKKFKNTTSQYEKDVNIRLMDIYDWIRKGIFKNAVFNRTVFKEGIWIDGVFKGYMDGGEMNGGQFSLSHANWNTGKIKGELFTDSDKAIQRLKELNMVTK